MIEAYANSVKSFKECAEIAKEKGVYEKIDCNTVGLTTAKFTDPKCKVPAKDSKGKVVSTTIKWGECIKVKEGGYKFTVDKKTVKAPKSASYMAVGSAAVLALIANQF